MYHGVSSSWCCVHLFTSFSQPRILPIGPKTTYITPDPYSTVMPSPFHQKYSSQSYVVPAMPEAPKEDAQRRGSDSSMNEPSSPDARRRVR
jgi:hypothetical protein